MRQLDNLCLQAVILAVQADYSSVRLTAMIELEDQKLFVLQ
jgi:hypothetical protein